MSDYRDLTHLTAADFDPNADPSITGAKIAQWIRTKAYGVDVREALAQWVEFNSAVLSRINEGKTENTNKKLTDMEQRMNDKINRITLGTDEDMIRLVVTEILQEQGVIN